MSSSVARLQMRMQAVIESTRRLDPRAFEFEMRARIRSELLPRLYDVTSAAIVVLDEVLARYDAPETGPEPEQGPDASGIFDLRFEEIVDARGPVPEPNRRIADVAFMA
ncbi:MAG: hypothetical protein KC431_31530, partial [Myxococcales bacterium]|nr:hypothetical protein [Myxococcales bacterium]